MPAPAIESFGGGGFRIGGLWRPGSLLVMGGDVEDWGVARLSDLTPADLDPVIRRGREAFEFLLLGTGAAQALPPKAVRDAVALSGLGLEFLATDAAARLHNVLASEGRRFATALVAL